MINILPTHVAVQLARVLWTALPWPCSPLDSPLACQPRLGPLHLALANWSHRLANGPTGPFACQYCAPLSLTLAHGPGSPALAAIGPGTGHCKIMPGTVSPWATHCSSG